MREFYEVKLGKQAARLATRAIDEKNRLVYKVEDGSIHILQCRNHYDDK